MGTLLIIGGIIAVLCLVILFVKRKSTAKRKTRSMVYSNVGETPFLPTQNAVNAINVDLIKVPAPQTTPLAKNPKFIYYIEGNNAGLTSATYHQMDIKFRNAGLQLIYMPLILQSLTEETLRFNFPGVKPTDDDVTAKAFYRKAAESLHVTLNENSRLFVSFFEEENCFSIYDLSSKTRQEFITKFFAYVASPQIARKKKDDTLLFRKGTITPSPAPKEEEDSGIRFSKVPRADAPSVYEDRDDSGIRFRVTESTEQRHDEFLKEYQVKYPKSADERFEEEQEKLVRQAKDLIQKLLMNNVSRDVIQSWLYDGIIISNLKVAKYYKIILPEYNNMEVKMTPLEKTVFLFFLKNPAGYTFKELPEHKDEVRRIYEKLAKTSNLDEIVKSVDDLTDPFGPSISEKCAHIKAKFISLMPEVIAKNYYISGGQGCAKRIPLDRAKVEWEVEI